MEIRSYNARIEGLTPLIMHWDSIEWADEMEAWKSDPANKKLSKPGDDRTPAHRWIGSTYHDGKTVCVPTANLSTCLLEAGALVPVPGGRSGKTFKAQTQSGMKLDGLAVPLEVRGKTIAWQPIEALLGEKSFPAHLNAVRRMGFDLMVKRAKVGASKHIRVRPVFEEWALNLSVSVWDEQITRDVLESIFGYAGQYKGLGDWRPSSPRRPGSYGLFKLAGLEQV